MDQIKQGTILELVKVAKEKRDTDAILQIVQYMQPLINKYAKNSYLAEYEDMQQELCLALIESIHKIQKIENEGQCVQYFANAIRNRFYEIYRAWKSLKREMPGNDELLTLNIADSKNYYSEIEFFIDMVSGAECKSDLQKEIMKCCILEEISDTDIANRLNISRQYVNRCKKRIFKKIIEEQDNL
jgi:RNA polymerase sigma factor (sigma-70 family)